MPRSKKEKETPTSSPKKEITKEKKSKKDSADKEPKKRGRKPRGEGGRRKKSDYSSFSRYLFRCVSLSRLTHIKRS